MQPVSGVRCRVGSSSIQLLTCLLVLTVTLQVVTSRVSNKQRNHFNHQNSSAAYSMGSSSSVDPHYYPHKSLTYSNQQNNHYGRQSTTAANINNPIRLSSTFLTTVTSYVDTPSGLEVDQQEVVKQVDDEGTTNVSGRRGGGYKNIQSRLSSSSSTLSTTKNHNNSNSNNNYHNYDRSYAVPNCSRCPLLEETINVTKEAIKLQILSKLGLKVAPNITKRALPRIPPLDHLLDKYGMQSDMGTTQQNTFKPGPVYEEAEDDYHAKMEKIISFAQEPPTTWGLPSNMAIQYFKFSHAVMVNKVVSANLWVYLNPPRYLPDAIPIWLHVYKVWRSETNLSYVLQDHVSSAKVVIKSRKGNWHTVDIRKQVSDWFRNPHNNLGIIIQAFDNEGRQLVATDRHQGADTSLLPFLEVYVMDESKRRTKRMIGLNCEEGSNEVRCCRYPLKVDFEEFGWDWIIAPKTYDANYCSGECPFVFLQKYPHTHLVQQANPSGSAGPCCAPRKMSPISMLYFDHEFNIIYGLLPGMVVDRCGCS
ncbi:Growth/differentiation factor 11 [Chamberlinius hualienensis]